LSTGLRVLTIETSHRDFSFTGEPGTLAITLKFAGEPTRLSKFIMDGLH